MMNNYLTVNEVAKLLDVTPSTIKKYYLLFEQNKYEFKRNNQGKLMFSEGDIELFRNLIDLKNKPGIIVSEAVEQLLRERGIYNSNDVSLQISALIKEINELKQLVAYQNQTIENLAEQLDRIEKHGKVRTQKKLKELEVYLINYIRTSMLNWKREVE